MKKTLLGIGALACILFAPSSKAQTSSQTELACPAGTSPLNNGTTVNNVTGKFRQNNCVDVFGNLYQVVRSINIQTFTCTIVNAVACISPGNPQGWAGNDIGGWINNINSNPAVCASVNCGAIQIAPGTYTDATAATITRPIAISCPGGPDATVVTWTPATGIMLTFSTTNQSGGFEGCFFKTSTSTTSLAIKLAYVNQFVMKRFHLNGFHGGVWSTGDGVSTHSLGLRMSEYLIDGTGGSGAFGVALDHSTDNYMSNFEWYSANADVSAVGLIVDYGVGGLYMSGTGTFEGGLHSMTVQQTNQVGGVAAANAWGTGGGTYDGTPGAIFPGGTTFDNSTGGDAILFDASLSNNPVRFYASASWVRFAGRNGGACITNSANGVNIQGGSDINFYGGNMTGNCAWGYRNNSSGFTFSSTDNTVTGNNQGNTAGVGGMLFTANPTNWRVSAVRSGNDAVDGGHQAYGLDISAASNTGVLSGNDFRTNTIAPINLPAGLGNIGVDAAYFGSAAGSNIIGPLILVEEAAPSGVGSSDVCYGDAVAHGVKCSYNNGTFSIVPLSPSATASMRFLNCGTTSTCSQTNLSAQIIVNGGPIALAAGTLTITSLPFTSSTTYVCSADDSTGINGIDVVYVSGASVTFNGTGTDSIRYACQGN